MLPFMIVYCGANVTVWMFDAHCYGIKSFLFAEKMSYLDYLTRSLPRARKFYTTKKCFKNIEYTPELCEELCKICLSVCINYINSKCN